MSDQQSHKLIDRGVAKINYFTAMAELAVNQIRKNISHQDAGYRDMISNLHEALTAAAFFNSRLAIPTFLADWYQTAAALLHGTGR